MTTPGWMGGPIDLVAIYADQAGQLFALEDSHFFPDTDAEAEVGLVLTRCSEELTRVLVERFGLPKIYLRGGDR
jgi:hypothetical protein